MPITETREIMWNIPHSFKYIMYFLFLISLAIMMAGFYKKYLFITGKEGIKSLLPQKLQWKSFFQTLFLTGKVTRKKSVGAFHSLIFYGFAILWIATDLVAIHYDTPFKIFQGPLYIVISFLADIAGIAILIGIALAFKRRYIEKPKYLDASKPNQEKYMYAVIISLIIMGYFIEGIRILGTSMPIGESHWSPVGWLLASALKVFHFSDPSLAFTYRLLWFFHMVNTMLFIASLGWTKFSHIAMLPLSALVTPKMRGAVLSPMDFEDENAETFGLGKFSELSSKNKLDLLTCVECGRCTQACPAQAAGKPLDPKKIITKARDLFFKKRESKNYDIDFWEGTPTWSSQELDSCTTCGACMEECPANIEHVNIILEAKRYKALTLGDIPAAAADAINKIKINGNPWGIAQDDRFNWANDLNIPLIQKEKKVDYLYYVGCAGSYDSANQKVVQDTIKLLKRAEVDFAVLGKNEKCNGDPIRRFGDEYTFTEVAIENIENLRQYKFDKIVTHCPHCLHTIGKEYAQFEGGEFKTIHHTELLADLLKAGKLKPQKEINQELTFHDPCYLGRHHGEYNAPREILKSIPGLKLKEMDKKEDEALCCGMGGGNMWYEIDEGVHLATKRLEQIGETKAEQLATSCSYCLINFNSSKAQVKSTEDIIINDVATILAKSISD